MKYATAFFIFMALFMWFAFGILVESAINNNDYEAQLKLTAKVQEQYWVIQDLEQNLSVCNWEVGNTQSIELVAPITTGLMRAYENE